MNRPPTPDDAVEEQEDQEKQPTLQEIINIKVLYLFLIWVLIFIINNGGVHSLINLILFF